MTVIYQIYYEVIAFPFLVVPWVSLQCVIVVFPFLVVPWVSLQCVIVVFPAHTHSRFEILTFVIPHVFICIYTHSFLWVAFDISEN